MFKCILQSNNTIVDSNHDYFTVIEVAWEASDIVIHNLERRNLKEGDLGAYRLVLVALFYKSCDCVLSISTLCAAGQSRDAHVILRKLFETVVNLKYISMNPAERSTRFGRYGTVHSHQLVSRALKRGGRLPVYQKELEKLHSQLSEQLAKESDSFCNDAGEIRSKYRDHWDGKSIPRMARSCGLLEDLDAYEVFNASTHTSSGDVGVYFDTEATRFRSGANDKDVPAILLETTRLFLIPLRLIVQEFKLDLEASLKQVQNLLNFYGNRFNSEQGIAVDEG